MIYPVIKSDYDSEEEYQKAYKKMIENIEYHKLCNLPVEDNRSFEECMQSLLEEIKELNMETDV